MSKVGDDPAIRRRPAAIANEIRMKRSQHAGAFFLVEGRDDRLFCERFVDRAACKATTADGKGNVEEVIDILECDEFPGVIGLTDNDFDVIDDTSHASENIVHPARHDLDAMLIECIVVFRDQSATFQQGFLRRDRRVKAAVEDRVDGQG